jgi:hypothetical protein
MSIYIMPTADLLYYQIYRIQVMHHGLHVVTVVCQGKEKQDTRNTKDDWYVKSSFVQSLNS